MQPPTVAGWPSWPRSRAGWAGLLLGTALVVAIAAWQLVWAGDIRIDDAYITFSFSKNLGAGHGPIYSNGVRVEGYSNFLWMVIVGLAYALKPGLDPYATARALMVPFALLLGASVYSLVRRHAGRPWAWLALVLLVLDGDLVLAALTGLETLPYTAILTTGIALYAARETEWTRRLTIPVLTAAALMRIDGVVPLALVAGYELVSELGAGRFSVRRYATWLLPGLAVYVAWFAWRWSYYGLPMPSPYYAKVRDAVDAFERGSAYAWQAFQGAGLAVGLPIMAAGIARRPSRDSRFLGFFAVASILYVIKVGGDWMPYTRFFLPVTPVLVVLFVRGLSELFEAARFSGLATRAGVTVALAAAFAFVGAHVDHHYVDSNDEQARIDHARSQTGHVAALVTAAKLLDLAVPPGRKLVTDYAGVLGVFTHAAVIDMWGLCNATIATRGTYAGVNAIYGRTCPECYRELSPDFFHTEQPLARGVTAFASHRDVVNAVWQHDAIGRYVDLANDFVAGRVVDERAGHAVWFLERRREGADYADRAVAAGIVVQYPFVHGKS